MKTIFFYFFFLLLVNAGFAQTIPADSLYLGQIPPTDIPKVFKLQVSPQHFAAERITISNDGKDIYYSEIKGYYPNTGESIKKYSFSDGKWTEPVTLFEGYAAPALSVTGDTMFVETNFETFISIKNVAGWSKPMRILTELDSAHYYQVTGNGNQYISTKSGKGTGLSDWCKISDIGADTTAVSLGRPINTEGENLDFFVSKDESFIIVTNRPRFGISYKKEDGNWTNPRNFGPKIDFGLGSWGPYVTPDNKYLFYTTGTKPDYSDVHVYWVRFDALIDSLKHTNIPPYCKNKIKSQSAFVGDKFSFTVPDDTFYDEDGNYSFQYSATLIDGSPLPSWLSFEAPTKTFSGTPTSPGELKILLSAKDKGEASGLGAFKLSITNNP